MRALLTIATIAVAAFVPAQEARLSATQLLDSAKAKAHKEGKSVFVLFDASWCKWCDRLKQHLEKPQLKVVMDQHFVSVTMKVYERGPKAKDETPGAYEVLDWLGGRKSGIPFYAVLTAEGKVLATSMRPVPESSAMQNTGHPATTEEIAHFVTMLRKGAPLASDEQFEAIRALLAAPPEPSGQP